MSQIQSDCGLSDTFPRRDCSQITPLFQPHFVLNPFMGNFLDPQSFCTETGHTLPSTGNVLVLGVAMSGDKGELLHLHFCFITYSLTLGLLLGLLQISSHYFAVFIVNLCCQHVNSVIWKGDQPGLEPRAFEFVPQCASATPLAWSETYNSITSSGQELAVFIVLLTGSWLRLLTSDNVSDDTALGNAYSAITVFYHITVFFRTFCTFLHLLFVQPG